MVSGMVRHMTGETKFTLLPADTVFGFKFWSRKDGYNAESLYDGIKTFEIDHDKKSFSTYRTPAMMSSILVSQGGGQLVFPDLIKIDTTGSKHFELTQDADKFYLKIILHDITQYDVYNRYKLLVIDKKLMLPLAMRMHQVTLDKVQDLFYNIKEIRLNSSNDVYDFTSQRYPAEYKPETSSVNKNLYSLLGKQFPSFSFSSFDGTISSSNQLKGKLVLLDFWEVWCGACIVSMPKVQALYEKYKNRGVEMFGVIHEKETVETAKLMIDKRKFSIPMRLGNEDMKKTYSINAVPAYILIDRTGKIVLVSEGYPEYLEEEIKKYLL